MLPLFILPLIRRLNQRQHQRPTTSRGLSALLSLPAYLALLLWPLALLILSLRLKQLNREHHIQPHSILQGRDFDFDFRFPHAPPRQPGENTSIEPMGFSVWAGISIIVYSLTSHHDTFYFLTSLKRPSSTAVAGNMIGSSRTSRAVSGSSTSGGKGVEGRRNQWPLACALGVGGSTVIQLGWGLVGYLGIENGGTEGNVLSSDRLPLLDGWTICVRTLVLFAILAQLESSLKTAYGRIDKVFDLILGTTQSNQENLNGFRRRTYSRARREDLQEQVKGWTWREGLVRLIVWFVVSVFSVIVCGWGEEGEGLVSLAEIAGAILSTFLAFIAPAFFFIALFHLRTPRSIFTSDPSLPQFTNDTLLMRKERQVQRKLSGRRVWQDVLTFGGLLPFGLVVLVRGCVALAGKEGV